MMGEGVVRFFGWLRLPSDVYYPIHNVTLKTSDGSTQIDHIFVSRFGIFVVETKNMKGWIFGGEKQPQWTQKIYKKTIKFQNPLRQNYKHVKALESLLDVPPNIIHSIVAFVGDCSFKTPMPANVTKGYGYIRYIKSFQTPILTEEEVQRIIHQIQSGRLSPTRETHRKHVQQLRARFESGSERKCPRCGSPMVIRTSKRGPNAGKKFWGCSAFPKCKQVQPVSKG